MNAFVLTAASARARSARAAAVLAGRGLLAGDRIAIVAPGAEVPQQTAAAVQAAVACAAYAALRLGALPVMVNPLLAAPSARATWTTSTAG